MKGQKALFSKASDEWETPQWLFDLLNKEFHFECDAAATQKNAKVEYSFGEDLTGRAENSLVYDWTKCLFTTNTGVMYPKIFWLNPPYSKIAAFMKKAYEESLKGAVVVCLIPCRTDTRYWHDYVMKAQEIRFVKGRLKFNDSSCGAPFPSCVVIFKNTPGLAYPYLGKTIEAVKK